MCYIRTKKVWLPESRNLSYFKTTKTTTNLVACHLVDLNHSKSLIYFHDLCDIDRVFLLDWRLPSGFEMVFIPRYIDWRYRAHFKDDDSDPSQSTLHHIHEIGANSWNQAWSGDQLFKFYTETDFNDYFSHDIEIIQSHSYDLTYAILRNKHHQEKLRSLGLDRTKCLLCCIWSYLFKNSQTFNRNLAILTKKQLGIAGNRDLVFLDLSLPVDHLSKTIQMAHAQEALKCTDKVVTVLQNPVCVVATNSYFLLEAVPTHYPRMNTNNGLFFTRERYLVELQREFNSSSRTSARKLSKNRVLIPKTERNALMNFFLSYYLQLNSTVLFTGVRSPFSENMAALRHFQRPSNTYVVRPGGKCKLERYTD